QNESMNPKVKEIRTLMHDTIKNRHEESVAKFGCALAMGIIDAGGRNCTISLQTQTGNNNAQAIVGAVVFTQYWYWFPLAHFLSLSFTPTAVIGVDQKLEVPVFEMYCRAKPSQFDYPPDPKTQKDEKIGKVKTAVLSTTAQAKRRAAKKGRAKSTTDENGARATPGPSGGNDKMDIDEPTKEGGVDADSKGTEAPAEEAKEEAKEAPKTPTKDKHRKQDKDKVGYTIENMSRVLPGQLQYLSFPSERYVPVKRPTGGILVVHDTKPDEPRETIELKSSTNSSTKPAPTAGQQPADQNQMGMLTLSNGERVHPLEALARARYGISLDQLAEEGEEQEEGAEAGAAAGAGAGGATGAAAAAGVLTAVDEDEEGGEDAPVPGAFDYESDNENGQGGDAMEED
ncbi:proteasome regulatory particle base subunit, partial [Ascosphaera atra]